MQDRPKTGATEDPGRSFRVNRSGPGPTGSGHQKGTVPAAGTDADPELEIAGVYVISVAARILEMHPQTLRKYERLGLVSPVRTVGMLRLYSPVDIQKILLIRHLMVNLELNLAGVKFALALVENLMGFRELIKIRVDDGKTRAMLEQEISRLFQNLDLPLDLLNLDLSNLPMEE